MNIISFLLSLKASCHEHSQLSKSDTKQLAAITKYNQLIKKKIIDMKFLPSI